MQLHKNGFTLTELLATLFLTSLILLFMGFIYRFSLSSIQSTVREDRSASEAQSIFRMLDERWKNAAEFSAENGTIESDASNVWYKTKQVTAIIPYDDKKLNASASIVSETDHLEVIYEVYEGQEKKEKHIVYPLHFCQSQEAAFYLWIGISQPKDPLPASGPQKSESVFLKLRCGDDRSQRIFTERWGNVVIVPAQP